MTTHDALDLTIQGLPGHIQTYLAWTSLQRDLLDMYKHVQFGPHCSLYRDTMRVFFKNFCWTHVILGLLVMSPLGFKARVGSALFKLCGGVCDIHSLRFTSGATPLPVYIASIAASHFSPHACFSRCRMPDLKHRPPAWQADALTTRPRRPGLPPRHVETCLL